jgi:hypothetical protein
MHLEGRPISRSTYERHGCRCDGCTADEMEHREYDRLTRHIRDQRQHMKISRERLTRRLKKVGLMNEHLANKPVSHNTYSRHGCRCTGCSLEHVKYLDVRRISDRRNKMNRPHWNKKPAHSIRKQVEFALANGKGVKQIMDELDIDYGTVKEVKDAIA